MKVYQIRTAKQFFDFYRDKEFDIEELLEVYAKDVATRFAAECVNQALGNKMEVSNALHDRINSEYNSIEWEQ